jgi:hypothetical protein
MRLLAVLWLAAAAFAQQPKEANYDEAKVPHYTLPDLLGGARDAKAWQQKRRPEVFHLIETQMFGRAPAAPQRVDAELVSIDEQALGGKAIRKQISVKVNGKPVGLLLYLPANAHGKVPVFLGLNFGGNHSVHADPGIILPETWNRTPKKALAPEASRGSGAEQWQVEKILAQGYGLATAYYEDIEPDFAGGIAYGIRASSPKPAADEWGTIATWAWGLSRIMDYLETDKDVDARRVALMGHSRLGKTALWAGAADARFALVISNDSGEGGAALSRRKFGEQVRSLNTTFPHWFCLNYRQYNDREEVMPFDAHMLLALIAPRPLYVASAQEDLWADPHGEFLAAVAASPAWALFGKKGISTDEMPSIHQPAGDTVRYHIRAGKHDVTAYDWDQYLQFTNLHLK